MPSYPQRAIHLTALWAYAVGQPVLSILGGNPEFFVLRGVTRSQVILFAIAVALVPPLLAIACEWLVARVWEWGANVLHALVLIAFLIPLALRLVRWIDPSTPDVALLMAWGISVAGATVYVLSRPAQLFLSFSLALPVVGLVWFVHSVPTATDQAEAARVSIPDRPPIVMVVLDELPLSSLLTRRGDLDSIRYPNFARLARDGTWYRNATTVHDFTASAVPAILTGRLPRNGDVPGYSDHPQNLFTLLGGTYAMRVYDQWTRLCPLSMCPRERSMLDELDDIYSDIGTAYLRRVAPHAIVEPAPPEIPQYRENPFGRFLGDISSGRQDGVLYVAHLLLPHAPWRSLPSGRTYAAGDTYRFPDSIEGLEYPGGAWTAESWLVEQAYQRHLLQLGYTDALVGRVLDQLDERGLYDRALVVVLADHGVSFQPGLSRRGVSRENLADIAAVPLFVKYPHQRRGGIDVRAARTIDVVPTIADVLRVEVPWALDGVSFLDPPARRPQVDVMNRRTGGHVSAPAHDVEREVRALAASKSGMFGAGRTSLFDIGSHKELLGTHIADSPPRSSTTRVRLEREELLRDVRTGSSFVPARIGGFVELGELSPGTELAIAVNGRVVALTRCSGAANRQWFRAMVPESAFQDGVNHVDVLAIERHGSRTRLVWLGGNRTSVRGTP